MTDKLYTVVQKDKNLFNIINAETGTVVNRIILSGEIMNGPIVVGDRCTFIVETGPNQRLGMIYKLPNGTIINRYPV